MVEPSGRAPSIPDGGVPVVVRPPRISTKGGTSVGIKRGADLAATRQPKEAKSRMHAKIDFKEGDIAQVPWGKAAAKKRAKMAHDATVVEIHWAKGA